MLIGGFGIVLDDAKDRVLAFNQTTGMTNTIRELATHGALFISDQT